MKPILNSQSITILVCFVLLLSCQTETSQNADDIAPPIIEQSIDNENNTYIQQTYSTPVDIVGLLLEEEIPYLQLYEKKAFVINEQQTQSENAILLGVLSVEIGYNTIYVKTDFIVDQIVTMLDLAANICTCKVLEETITNMNHSPITNPFFSLMNGFQEIDYQLRINNKDKLADLIQFGTWLENLHLAICIEQKIGNERVRERIAEQKIIIENFGKMLRVYKNESDFNEILAYFDLIAEAYSTVKVQYQNISTTEKSITNETPVFSQDEISLVEISDEQLEEIIDVVKYVRAKLLGIS